MGYRINYQPIRKFRSREPARCRLSVLTGFFLLIFCIITYHFWPEGRLILQRILIPGNPTVTLPAIDTLLFSLSQGEQMISALETFCLSILEGADFAAY